MSEDLEQFFLEVDGEPVEVLMVARPFREGREVRFRYRGNEYRVGELGFGRLAVEERVRAEVKKIRAQR